MREKIIVVITCFVCIGLYLNSKKSHIDESSVFNNLNKYTEPKYSNISNPTNEDSTIDILNNPTENFDSSDFEINSSLSKMNNCLLGNQETNMMSFKEAFGYYRKCLGSDNQFNWKGIEYTTLLFSEIENQIVDSTRSENNTLNQVSGIR